MAARMSVQDGPHATVLDSHNVRFGHGAPYSGAVVVVRENKCINKYFSSGHWYK
jgi:hypothetical protein